MLNRNSSDHRPSPEELFERFGKRICKPQGALEESVSKLKLNVGLAFYLKMPETHPELFKDLCVRCYLFQLRAQDTEPFLKHFLGPKETLLVEEEAIQLRSRRTTYEVRDRD